MKYNARIEITLSFKKKQNKKKTKIMEYSMRKKIIVNEYKNQSICAKERVRWNE